MAKIDLSDNCYYQVGSDYFTPTSFKIFLKGVRSDFLFFTRLIPLDNQEVKNLIDDSNDDILSIHPVGNYLDGFEVKKSVKGYHFFNRSSKTVGVYLNFSDPFLEICTLRPGEEYDFHGSGPFFLYNGDEVIKGVE
ncbi:hypothetical protein ACQ1PL_07975 [Ornithobacterium rhinotracheale]